MSKIFFRDHNNVLSDVIGEFETTDNYISSDAIVVWNDVINEMREIVLSGNFLGKPTIVAQHGLRATREYISPYNKPLLADNIMVWGPKDKERMIQGGVEEDRIIITGSTIFDHLIPRQAHQGVNVVFAPMHWYEDLEENLIVAEKLREISGINVITKVVDNFHGSSYFDNLIFSNTNSPDHLTICASVLSTADIVISITESTFEFLAYALDIPVLTVNLWKPKFHMGRLYMNNIISDFSNACQKINLDDLPKALSETLANPQQFASERKKALYEEAGIGWDNSTPKQRIIKAINKSISETNYSNNETTDNIKRVSKRLTQQMTLKEDLSQRLLGSVKENLEEVKKANQSFYLRSTLDKLTPNVLQTFNPLNFPICFEEPHRLVDSAWIEHVPFGMCLIDILRPKVLVELGTYTGVSYCAFCQAVKQLGTDTHCYAVDTWEGDIHGGFYGTEILADLQAYHDPLYSNFSSLLQSTFDDAIKYFSDGSIDLLHIDGLHTYEAVKHDYNTWFPKLSDQAVVVFHDISVREKDFGVWKLWEELIQQYPHFEFVHGHGLGILGVGGSLSSDIRAFFSMPEKKIMDVKKIFLSLGSRLSQKQALVAINQTIQTLTTQLAEQGQSIQALTNQVNELDEELISYAMSNSWRITRPLRKISQIFKKGA